MVGDLALDFTWVRPSSGGVGSVAVGVARGLSELGVKHECLVSSEREEEWTKALTDSFQSSVTVVRIGTGITPRSWGHVMKSVMPERWRAGAAMTMMRRLHSLPTRTRIGDRTVWAPFHRVPLLATHGVLTLHDLRVFESGLESKVDQQTIAGNVARAKAVVCSWPHPYSELIRRFPAVAAKAFLVPLPVLMPGNPPIRHREIIGDLRLLYPASVAPHKNHETLIRALVRIPGARLVCTGGEVSSHASEVRRIAESLGVSDRIEWRGFITEAELELEYDRAHVLVMPTRWEAASGPILEAVARELPFVASDIVPIRAQLDEMGLKVPTFAWYDPDALASSIHELVANYGAFVQATRVPGRRVRARSWSDTASEYMQVFGWVDGSMPYPKTLAPGKLAIQPHSTGGIR